MRCLSIFGAAKKDSSMKSISCLTSAGRSMRTDRLSMRLPSAVLSAGVIDGCDDKAAVRQRRRHVVMTTKPSGSAMRDNNERQLVTDNGAISGAGDHSVANRNLLLGCVAWVPNRTSEGLPSSVGRHVKEPHASRLHKRGCKAQGGTEYVRGWSHDLSKADGPTLSITT